MRPAHALFSVTAAVGFAAAFAAAAQAQTGSTIDPATVDATIGVGETITIHKTVTIGSAAGTNVDVFFLADNTGSMFSTINDAKAGATDVLNALPSEYHFGVGHYFGDPSEGVSPSVAYGENQALTSDHSAVQTGINGWIASGGGDTPEANFFALQQVANTAAWRPDAQRVIVWFGDAPSHTETTTEAQAIAALQAANAKVVAFNNGSSGSGIDGSYFPDPSGQASRVVAAAGGSLTNGFNSGTDFVGQVTSAISSVASSIDLAFSSDLVGSGLSLAFTCTSTCTGLAAGDVATFDLAITGVTPGTYDFNVFTGTDAVESDHIVVGAGGTSVPEPASIFLLGIGLVALIGVKRRQDEGSLA